jgi:SAM-dependent methyltransferase
MPEEGRWEGFFAPDRILDALGLDGRIGDAADFGCGYGTFAIPAARRIRGTLHAVDLDPAMIDATRRLAAREGVRNLRLHTRDFVAEGTGLAAESVDFAMLFNILHAEDPHGLLREARRVLSPGGRVAAIHWNYDPATPRGPPMAIRPRPEDCMRWMTECGFVLEGPQIELPPYHYGIVARRNAKATSTRTGLPATSSKG